MAKKSKSSFSIFNVIKKIVFAPSFVFIIVYIWQRDWRVASLVSLYLISFFAVIRLVTDIAQIILSTVTLNVFGIVRHLLELITEIFILGIYWGVYLYIWGTEFGIQIS